MKKKNLLFCLTLAVSLVFCREHGMCVAAARRQAAQTQKAGKQPAIDNHSAKADAIVSVFRTYNRHVSYSTANSYANFVLEAGARYGIDPGLIAALIVKESTVKANARSRYAVGLMQVYWKLHRKAIMAQFPHIKTEKDVIEPRNNIFVGVWLYSRYLKDCGGNEKAALRRYLGQNSQRYLNQINSYRKLYNDRLKINLRKVKK